MSRFEVTLADLEATARVAAADVVTEQAEPRLHEPWLAGPHVGTADGGGGDADGD